MDRTTIRPNETNKSRHHSSTKPPPQIIITLPILPDTHILKSTFNTTILPPPILLCKNPPNHRRNNNIRTQIPKRKPMPKQIPRRSFRSVKLRAQHSAQIPNGNLHRTRDSAFRLSGDIVSGPGESERGGGIDSCGGEEGS